MRKSSSSSLIIFSLSLVFVTAFALTLFAALICCLILVEVEVDTFGGKDSANEPLLTLLVGREVGPIIFESSTRELLDNILFAEFIVLSDIVRSGPPLPNPLKTTNSEANTYVLKTNIHKTSIQIDYQDITCICFLNSCIITVVGSTLTTGLFCIFLALFAYFNALRDSE
jgi:hypothetical protein